MQMLQTLSGRRIERRRRSLRIQMRRIVSWQVGLKLVVSWQVRLKKLASIWSRGGPSLAPVYNQAKHKICALPITPNVGPCSWFKYGFLLSASATTVFSCSVASSVELILLLILVVVLRSSLPGIARYRRPGDCMKISLFLFSMFCLS